MHKNIKKGLRCLSGLLSCLLGIFTLVLVFLGYQGYEVWLGMPDGYITDHDKAMRVVYRVTAFPISALGLYFLYLGWQSLRHNISKRLILSFLLLVIFLMTIIVLNQYFYTHLDHGQGG